MRFPSKACQYTRDNIEVGARWSFTYGHVQNDNGRDEANASSADDTASAHNTQASGSSFKNATNGEDSTAGYDGCSTPNEVGEVAGDESAEKGTAG